MPQKTKAQRLGKSRSRHGRPAQRHVPWFKVGWGVVGALLLISASVSLYLLWFNVQEHCTRSPHFQGVKASITGPAFLPLGDNAEFLVTVTNERSTAAEVSLDLRYVGTSLCNAAAGESHRVNFGPIQSGEEASRKVTALFPLCLSLKGAVFQNWPGRQVEFEVWLTVDAQPPERIETIALPVAPLPKAKTLGKWAGGWLAALALWTGKELWDQIKKTVQPPIPGARSTA